MCGIFGYCGDYGADQLEAMAAALAHRGPDHRGLVADAAQRLGLGQTRLAIIDLSSTGHQPMADASGRFTVVYNGEIYNYRELRAELQAQGAYFRGQSDTEVMLEWYARIGDAVLPRLNGIFALAIWDRERGELFLARDPLGVKPLYFTEGPSGFAFASELKALLPLLRQRTLDAVSLHRYVSFLWCPGEGTPLREVRKLPPGEAMLVRGGKIVRRWTWYRLPLFRGVTGDLSAEAALTGTLDGLRRAVRRQLVADVPVGAFLSGGLDSSAIVALAREQVPDIRCFTIESVSGQESDNADDLPYARRVARHLNVPLEVVRIESGRMADDFERMVVHLDEPLADPAPLNVLYISQLARGHGVKVLLSGAGGDDLFAGYRRHLAVHYEPCWRWLPARVRSGLERWTSGLDQRNSLFRRLAKSLNGASLEGDAHVAAYFAWAREEDLLKLYSPEFRANLGQACGAQPMLDFLGPLPASVSALDKMLALEQRFFLADHNLTYTDKMSMATGVEVRVPFLDLDLVEHAARIPIGLKQRGRVGKWVLKRAMEPYLPKDVIYRPKTGFGAPLRRWLRHELRTLVDDMLSADTIRRRGLFDSAAVTRMVQADREGRVDAAYSIFAIACVEIWCRNFLDQRL
jgi:asparagine synthase (glutamine-hydrolysing)